MTQERTGPSPLRSLIESTMRESIESGLNRGDAANAAVDTLKRQNLTGEFFAEFGRRCIIHLWADWQHDLAVTIRSGGLSPESARAEWREPGKRKVNAEAYNRWERIMALKCEAVDGEEKSILSLTHDDITWIIDYRRKVAAAYEKTAEAWEKIRRALKKSGKRTLGEAFKGRMDKLAALYRNVEEKD